MKNSTLCVLVLVCLFSNAIFSQDGESPLASSDSALSSEQSRITSETSLLNSEQSQLTSEKLQLTSKDSIVQSAWMFGLGYNFVDDSGDMVDELLSFDDQWNGVSYPSRVSVGRYFKSGVGVEGIATYNKYKVGKFIDGATNLEKKPYPKGPRLWRKRLGSVKIYHRMIFQPRMRTIIRT